MKFTNEERNELLKTINYSRFRVEYSKQYLLNRLAVKINFGCDTFSVEDLQLILQMIGFYLNEADSANSSHIVLYHRVDIYSHTLA